MIINHDEIILTRPEKGLNIRKVVSVANVVFFWFLMLYIMRSLLVVCGWLIASLIFGKAFNDGGFGDMVHTVRHLYLPLVLIAFVLPWAWARYNRARYGGFRDKRRVQPDPLTLEQMSEFTDFSLSKLTAMRMAKVVVCHFDESTELKDVDCFSDSSMKKKMDTEGTCIRCVKKLSEVKCYRTGSSMRCVRNANEEERELVAV